MTLPPPSSNFPRCRCCRRRHKITGNDRGLGTRIVRGQQWTSKKNLFTVKKNGRFLEQTCSEGRILNASRISDKYQTKKRRCLLVLYEYSSRCSASNRICIPCVLYTGAAGYGVDGGLEGGDDIDRIFLPLLDALFWPRGCFCEEEGRVSSFIAAWQNTFWIELKGGKISS